MILGREAGDYAATGAISLARTDPSSRSVVDSCSRAIMPKREEPRRLSPFMPCSLATVGFILPPLPHRSRGPASALAACSWAASSRTPRQPARTLGSGEHCRNEHVADGSLSGARVDLV